MKILKSWLEEWIDLSDIKDNQLLNIFESLGYEIEGYKKLSPNYKNIIVGTVIDLSPIPKAEKIRLAKVDVGTDQLEIICGAWNFDIDDKVAVASSGTYIRDNFKIERKEIMGIVSDGMICSPYELDLWNDEDGILVINENFSNGTLLNTCYQSHDLMIDLSITPNRGDSMSHYGLARELGTATQKKINNIKNSFNNDFISELKVNHGVKSSCRSYFAMEIDNIEVENSSLDIRFKLGSVGVRPINNFVDATNYILFDLGQPLHAFDRDKLNGPISVRKAKESEVIKTLDGEKRKLKKDDILIVDNDVPIALGGVMGGYDSQITQKTKRILIESANFDTVNILNTSRNLNLISEASIRFERGVDNFLQENALVLFRECILKSSSEYNFSSITGTREKKRNIKVISFNSDYFKKIIGVSIDKQQVKKIFNGLGLEFDVIDENTYNVYCPSWRYDIEREIDLVEELARHLNYDSFPSTISYGNNFSVGSDWNTINEISNSLVSEGYFECCNLSFISYQDAQVFTPERAPVSLSNPLDESQKYLRTTTTPHLLRNLANNINMGNDFHPLFEIGISFIDLPSKLDPDIPKQTNYLTIASSDQVTSSDIRLRNINYDIYNIKNIVKRIVGNNISIELINRPGLHSKQSFTIMSDSINLGWFGKVSEDTKDYFNLQYDTYLAEINLDKLSSKDKQLHHYIKISNFPHVKFDLSFEISNETISKDVLKFISSLYPDFENSSYIFDEYFDPVSNNRTIGFRIKLRSYEKTIGDNDLVNIRSNIIKEISSNFPAILRDNE